MSNNQWQQLVDLLTETAGIQFDAGLTDNEIADVEHTFEFRFPPDLAEFLQTALPVSDGFPNWRTESSESIRKRLDSPLVGVLFDVELNDFWLPEWGARPANLDDALEKTRSLIKQAPKLIPIYIHRMMPDRPHKIGNPVFSVHQTDIIYYGVDLRDYLIHEFLNATHADSRSSDEPREIEFWDIDRFLDVRWANGPVIFDNREGLLP
jgi:hypothetical protein